MKFIRHNRMVEFARVLEGKFFLFKGSLYKKVESFRYESRDMYRCNALRFDDSRFVFSLLESDTIVEPVTILEVVYE